MIAWLSASRKGLLKVGIPKTWDESKANLEYIRHAGVRQFISTYNRVKDFKGDDLLWGDEIEYGIFVLDEANKKVRLSLRAKEVTTTILNCLLYLLDLFFDCEHFSQIFLFRLFFQSYIGHG